MAWGRACIQNGQRDPRGPRPLPSAPTAQRSRVEDHGQGSCAHSGVSPACGLTQSRTPGCISALGNAEWQCLSNFGLESGVAFADKEEIQSGWHGDGSSITPSTPPLLVVTPAAHGTAMEPHLGSSDSLKSTNLGARDICSGNRDLGPASPLTMRASETSPRQTSIFSCIKQGHVHIGV